MSTLLDYAGVPSLLLTAVLIYGFAPGFVLRLTILLYPKNDSRRLELVAELYALPRWKRPMWVAEQIETGLFDGLRERWLHRQAKNLDKKNKTAPNSSPETHLISVPGSIESPRARELIALGSTQGFAVFATERNIYVEPQPGKALGKEAMAIVAAMHASHDASHRAT